MIWPLRYVTKKGSQKKEFLSSLIYLSALDRLLDGDCGSELEQ